MIALEQLKEKMETGLNALSTQNQLGIMFKLFTDAGEYEKARISRTKKQRYTNGLLEILSSSIVPVQNLTVGTVTAQLSVTVQLLNSDTDRDILSAHRALLDGYFQNTSLQTLDDEDGKTFNVSSVASLASTGMVAAEAPLGTHTVFTVSVTYAMVQNGLNSSECILTFDGVTIAYSDFTIVRTSVTDAAAYSGNDGVTKNVIDSTSLTFNILLPATVTDNAANEALQRYLLDGDISSVHKLTVEVGNDKRTYNVVFAETNLSLNGMQNAGYTVNLIEAAKISEEGENGSA